MLNVRNEFGHDKKNKKQKIIKKSGIGPLKLYFTVKGERKHIFPMNKNLAHCFSAHSRYSEYK